MEQEGYPQGAVSLSSLKEAQGKVGRGWHPESPESKGVGIKPHCLPVEPPSSEPTLPGSFPQEGSRGEVEVESGKMFVPDTLEKDCFKVQGHVTIASAQTSFVILNLSTPLY